MSQQFSLEAFIFVIILLIYIFTSHFIELTKVPYIHQSMVCIFMGIVAAIFVKYGLNEEIEFSRQLFFAIILPPIIASAGYGLRKSHVFQNLKLVTFYGVIGTLVCFICLSCFIVLINSFIFNTLTLTEALMISSILCATDNVASLSLFKNTNFNTLHSVLFGQGIINTAVSITLFRVVAQLQFDQSNQFKFWTVLVVTFKFTYLFVFSIAFGILSGLGLSYLFKRLDTFAKYPLKEISLILLNSYFTYLMGELLGLSGVISLLTCSIVMGRYCYMNISKESQRGTALAFQTVGYIAEAFVLAYLGASILSIQGKWAALLMALLILISLPFIRAIMVFTLPLIYRLLGKTFPLNWKELQVFWYGGMVRGAISFAMCLQIQSTDKKYINTLAITSVLITTIISTTTLKKFMRKINFNISQQTNQICDESQKQRTQRKRTQLLDESDINKKSARASNSNHHLVKKNSLQNESLTPGSGFSKFYEYEQKFLKPILAKNGSHKKMTYELDEDKKQAFEQI